MKAIACAIMVVAGALPLPPDTSLTMHTFADVWVFIWVVATVLMLCLEKPPGG
jgi:hypothetical protein